MTTIITLLALLAFTPDASEPLPSWKDTGSKKAIVAFVNKVNTTGIPEAERIAVFDNDGTLWSEQPMYFQMLFAFDRIAELAPKHPEWKTQEPFASVLKGDVKGALAGGEKALLEMVMATHAGMSTEEFEAIVSAWINTARHPDTGRPFTEMIYAPMLELLRFLRANNFKTFIVSGGGIEFMRVFAEEVYGVPREQVIGSSIKTEYVVQNGKPAIVRLPEMNFLDDKAGKPIAIHQHIGRRPLFAGGNSDGDFQMLEWTTQGKGDRFGLLILHDDAKREWAYSRKSHIGKLDRGLNEAPTRGWTIVSMKDDWNVIFPPK